MTENKPQEKDELEHRKGHSFPLVVECDMQDEMQAEAADLCVTGDLFYAAVFILLPVKTYTFSGGKTFGQLFPRVQNGKGTNGQEIWRRMALYNWRRVYC